ARRLVGVEGRIDEAQTRLDVVAAPIELARGGDAPVEDRHVEEVVGNEADAVAQRARAVERQIEVEAVLPAPFREGLSEVLRMGMEAEIGRGIEQAEDADRRVDGKAAGLLRRPVPVRLQQIVENAT